MSEMTPNVIQPAYAIGERYRVPCVEVKDYFGFSGWLPVTGPWHEDKEIVKFDAHHYHVDWRFTSDSLFARIRYPHSIPIVEHNLFSGDVKLKTLVCRRHPGYPLHKIQKNWLPKLEAAFADKRVTCGTCPHRGIPLDGLEAEGGKVTCPGHGLTWSVKTGELVRTCAVEESAS